MDGGLSINTLFDTDFGRSTPLSDILCMFSHFIVTEPLEGEYLLSSFIDETSGSSEGRHNMPRVPGSIELGGLF